MSILRPVDLGMIDYRECVSLQQKLTAQRHAGEIADTLLLLEHPPVITLGTAGGRDSLLADPEALARAGIDVCETDRGGNITYHGPGQLVGYPIIDLRVHGKDVHAYLRRLEQVIVGCLADFGLAGETMPGYTGVWVDGRKICSIGVAVRRWITYHGFALNVNPNFEHWGFIHPCGLVGREVTSLERLLGHDPGMATVKESAVASFAKVFGCQAIAPSFRAGEDVGEQTNS